MYGAVCCVWASKFVEVCGCEKRTTPTSRLAKLLSKHPYFAVSGDFSGSQPECLERAGPIAKEWMTRRGVSRVEARTAAELYELGWGGL